MSPIFLAKARTRGCSSYLEEPACSKRDLIFNERRVVIGRDPEESRKTSLAALQSNDPGNAESATKASCSVFFRRSNEFAIALRNDSEFP